MEGNKRVDELMLPVLNAINRNVKDRDAKTDIYNRAYEALLISMDVMNMEISNLNSEVSALREQVRWIPVSERLPKPGKIGVVNVIAIDMNGSKIPFQMEYSFSYQFQMYSVTHWIDLIGWINNLPQPPEAE